MDANLEPILDILQVLPPPAVREVADFTDYLFRKYVHPAMDEYAARRKANRWLVERVGNMVMADQPVLTPSGNRPVWRFGAFVTSLSHAPRGPIGHLDVDATTGDVLANDHTIKEMKRRGARLARSSPSAGG